VNDRSTEPHRPAIADQPDLITPQWLTSAFRFAGHDVTVTDVGSTQVGTGQMGTCTRLRIRYDGAHPGLPETLVAKLPAADESRRAMVAGIYRTEVEFYRVLAPTLAVRTPRCYYSDLSEDRCRFVLLLEDLAPRTQGDQILGCSVDQARVAVENLAGLHGPRWCDPTLGELDWMTMIDEEGAEMVGSITGAATGQFLDRYSQRLDRDDCELLRSIPERLPAWILSRSERFAPLHGDYRLDNLLFGSGDDPVAAVDWQTVTLGLPGRDLAYFLGTGLEPVERRAAERELVASYHAALVRHGVEGYSFETCFEDYRFGMLQGPLITIVGAAYGEVTARGDDMFLAMASRSCAAIRDLATLDAL
jgi:hypothetical protein